MAGSPRLRIGRIRCFDLLSLAFVALCFPLLLSSVRAQSVGFTLDFETGDLGGWTVTGNAFRCQPTLGDNPPLAIATSPPGTKEGIGLAPSSVIRAAGASPQELCRVTTSRDLDLTSVQNSSRLPVFLGRRRQQSRHAR
jgi:hypothetical protein